MNGVFMSPEIRRSPSGLFIAAIMYLGAVLLYRCAVFFIAYTPPYAEKAYVPAIGEFALTIGLVATIIFVYRVMVTLLVAQSRVSPREMTPVSTMSPTLRVTYSSFQQNIFH